MEVLPQRRLRVLLYTRADASANPAFAKQIEGLIGRLQDRAANRQAVDGYNKAATLANNGDVAAALELLNGLLELPISDESLRTGIEDFIGQLSK